MARRLHGDFVVERRPGGGAVLTIKSVTGEAFEIERNADQVAEIVSALSPKSLSHSEHATTADQEPEAPVKRSTKASKSKEDNTHA